MQPSQPSQPSSPSQLTQTVLVPNLVQYLLIDPALHPRGQPHLSAASGLVRRGRRLIVVADDELHLGLFEEAEPGQGHLPSTAANGTLLRLLEGQLPKDTAQRKAVKPDLESLALLPPLPPLPGCPAGALLALGSGSTLVRQIGVLIALDVQGAPNGRMARLDLKPLYAPLRKVFAQLNIEGALVVGTDLLLLQRGSQSGSAAPCDPFTQKAKALPLPASDAPVWVSDPNNLDAPAPKAAGGDKFSAGGTDTRSACIRYDLRLIAPWLAGLQASPPAPTGIQPLQMGRINGVPLSLTDGAPLHDGMWMFCAVAENTASSYDDGPCVGSAIGIVRPDGSLHSIYPLQGAPKVEGISVQRTQAGDWQVTLVTDPDDPARASQVLRVQLPAPTPQTLSTCHVS